MPKIPVTTPQISTNVIEQPVSTGLMGVGASAEGTGRGVFGQGIAQFGQSLSRIGVEITNELKVEEAKQASSEMESSFTQESEKKIREITNSAIGGKIPRRQPSTSPDALGEVITDSMGNPLYELDENREELTVTGAWKKWADRRYKDSQMQLPSRMAQLMYQDKAGGYLANRAIRLEAEEQVLRVNHMLDRRQTRMDSEAQLVMNNPTGENVKTTVLKFTSEIMGSKLEDESTKLKTLDTLKALVSEKRFEGIIQNIQDKSWGETGVSRSQRISEALMELAGEKTPVGMENFLTFPEMLKPDDAARLKNQLLQLQKESGKIDASDLRAQFRDMEAASRQGWQVPTEQVTTLMRRLVEAINVGAVSPHGGTQMAAGPIFGKLVDREVQQNKAFIFTPEAARLKMLLAGEAKALTFVRDFAAQMGVSGTAFVGAATSKEYVASAMQYNEKLKDQYKTDNVDFVIQHSRDPRTGAYAGSLKPLVSAARPEAWGRAEAIHLNSRIGSVRTLSRGFDGNPTRDVFTKPEGEQLAESLSSPPSNPVGFNLIAKRFSNMRATLGDNYGAAIFQMLRDKQLPTQYAFALTLPRKKDIMFMVEAIRSGDTILENATPLLKERGVDLSQLKLDVDKAMTPLTSHHFGKDPMSAATLEQVSAMRKTALVATVRSIVNNPSFSTSDAIRDMTNRFLTGKGAFVEIPGSKIYNNKTGQKTIMHIPAHIGKKQLTDWDKALIAEYLPKIKSADHLRGKIKPPPGETYGASEEDFFKLVDRTGKVKPMSDESGVWVEFRDNKGIDRTTFVDGHTDRFVKSWPEVYAEALE